MGLRRDETCVCTCNPYHIDAISLDGLMSVEDHQLPSSKIIIQ